MGMPWPLGAHKQEIVKGFGGILQLAVTILTWHDLVEQDRETIEEDDRRGQNPDCNPTPPPLTPEAPHLSATNTQPHTSSKSLPSFSVGTS